MTYLAAGAEYDPALRVTLHWQAPSESAVTGAARVETVLVPRANGKPGHGASFKFHLTAPGPAPGGQKNICICECPLTSWLQPPGAVTFPWQP